MQKTPQISCKKYTLALCLVLVLTPYVLSQQAHIQSTCLKYLTSEFIQDGRDYTCFVKQGEKCSFHITLYGQSTYRLVTCSDKPGGSIQYKLFDANKNLLFDNAQHEHSNYWDFNFKNTIDCTIEVRFADPSMLGGFIYMVLAYKKDQ